MAARASKRQGEGLTPTKLTLTPQLLVNTLGSIITEAVAFGILDAGLGQTIVAIAGIVIPAAFSVAQGLHLGRVHAAVVAKTVPVVPAPIVPAPPVVPPK